MNAFGCLRACAGPCGDAILDRIMQRHRRFTLTSDSLRAGLQNARKNEKNANPC
ncbi:hypothetical protein [Lacisediminimonas profundi]|uniref:hypothetical protein n=1 Tax=Lacisediminimonas profundi TaxID=2603856 RepID=UPI0013872FF3|nr:hypothetical protein [Lacisediminimonas profundi]